MNLGDFHSLLEKILNQGPDSQKFIVPFAKDAAKKIERNHTYRYMEKFNSGKDLSKNSSSLELGVDIKSFGFIRIPTQISGEDPNYSYLRQVDPGDFNIVSIGLPRGFWMAGGDSNFPLSGVLYFDRRADQDYLVEFWEKRYSAWPSDAEDTHWLLEHGRDLLIAETMMLLALPYRDPELRQLGETQRVEGFKTTIKADQELREALRSADPGNQDLAGGMQVGF